MISLLILLTSAQPTDSVELVLSQMERLRDELSTGEARQRDRGEREAALINAVDDARLALFEAQKALQLVRDRLVETSEAVEREKVAEREAMKREQKASENARHALGSAAVSNTANSRLGAASLRTVRITPVFDFR